VEVRPGSSARISWTRVRNYFTMGRSVTFTEDAAVDLFQQHILKEGNQVRANGSLYLTPNLRVIHRATSLLLSNLKTNKLPMRLGWPSNLPLVTNCQRTSRLRDGFNHMTHRHMLCTSVTECISSRVRLLYAFPIEPTNEYFRAHCLPGRQSIRSSTFDHLRHPPMWRIYRRSEHTTVLRSVHRHQQFFELPAIPK